MKILSYIAYAMGVLFIICILGITIYDLKERWKNEWSHIKPYNIIILLVIISGLSMIFYAALSTIFHLLT